jgi:cell fate (sporulation/competence/biofilm development) regulator YlbF (YheA/YmcA/DUF963 family)
MRNQTQNPAPFYLTERRKMKSIAEIYNSAKLIKELEKAMNELDNCIGDCSQEVYDAISDVYMSIDDLKHSFKKIR